MSREVPEGWRLVRLGDLVAIERAAMTMREINRCEIVRLYSLPAFDHGAIPEGASGGTILSNKNLVPEDCILFSKLNPRIPRVWRVRHQQQETALCSTEFWPLTPKTDNVDLDFLAIYLGSNAFLNSPEITPASSTNSHQRVDRKSFEVFELMLPTLAEQRRIANILSSIDDAIASTQAVIEQTKKVKQATLERLLTKGIDHTRFKQTDIGGIPDSWIITTADEICSQISVGIVIKPSRYYTDDGIRCFRSANVREGFIEDADWVFITEEGNTVNRKSILKTGDVLVVRTGYPGTSCVVTPEFDGANCIDIIFARPDLTKVEPRFLSAFINSESGKLQVLKAEGGLAQKHFNVGSMKVMKIPLPTIAEQREIVRHIEDFTQAENSLKKLLEQYKCMKSALMSDLLTGRKRVTDTLPLAAE